MMYTYDENWREWLKKEHDIDEHEDTAEQPNLTKYIAFHDSHKHMKTLVSHYFNPTKISYLV